MSVSWSLTYAENFFLDNIFALIYLYFFIRFSHDQWKRHPLVSESLERGSGWILKGTLGSVIHSLGIIRDQSSHYRVTEVCHIRNLLWFRNLKPRGCCTELSCQDYYLVVIRLVLDT